MNLSCLALPPPAPAKHASINRSAREIDLGVLGQQGHDLLRGQRQPRLRPQCGPRHLLFPDRNRPGRSKSPNSRSLNSRPPPKSPLLEFAGLRSIGASHSYVFEVFAMMEILVSK